MIMGAYVTEIYEVINDMEKMAVDSLLSLVVPE